MRLIESTETYVHESNHYTLTVSKDGRVKWTMNGQACTPIQERCLNLLRLATDEGDDDRTEYCAGRLAETFK